MSEDQVDYGPLAALIGTWQGDKGMDVSPEPDGTEENPYYETLVFDAAGEVTNAESQTLSILRYHQVVRRKSDDEIFHDQVGYWTWDRVTGTIAQSLTIPRAVCVLAGGSFDGDPDSGEVVLEVRAKRGDPDWGVVQSPFMLEKASTEAFEHKVSVWGDTLRYKETTSLQIYGRSFEHTDENELRRTSE